MMEGRKMVDDTMIDKVMKLLAKAESTTPEEAEALVAKATELMVRHEIDQAMLATARGEKSTDVIIEKRITFKGTYAVGIRDLMFAIGRANNFRLIQGKGYGIDLTGTWIGFSRDLANAEVLLTSLMIQQAREAGRFMQTTSPLLGRSEKYQTKRSHMMGFADGVQTRMMASRRAAEDAAQKVHVAACPDSTTSVALVLKDKDEQVKDWFDERYGRLRAGRRRHLAGSWNARSAGHMAGQSADLGGTSIGNQKALGR